MDKKNPLLQYPYFIGLYLNQLLNLQLWLDNANTLLEASKLLEPQLREFWNIAIRDITEGRYNKEGNLPISPPLNLHGPYFILVSYALENLFKALIIRDRSDEIRSQFEQTGKLSGLIKTHDLIKLSKEANIKMDINEEDVLIRLSRQSKWKGRYPVPVELSDMQNILKYSDDKGHFTDYYKPDDIDQIDTIVTRLRDHLKVTK